MKTLIHAASFIFRAIGQDLISPDRSEDNAARHRAGRNGFLFCAVVIVLLIAAKCHAQRFSPVEHPLPPDPLHLSPADTSPGADPKRGLDNLPEATEERYMAVGGIIFITAYLGVNWLDRRNKRKI